MTVQIEQLKAARNVGETAVSAIEIEWIEGDAEALPFPDERFGG